jgi:hypothetical protein
VSFNILVSSLFIHEKIKDIYICLNTPTFHLESQLQKYKQVYFIYKLIKIQKNQIHRSTKND